MNSISARTQLGRAGSQDSRGLATRPITVAASGFASMNVVMDWVRGEIWHRGGRRCKLSVREAALLACLARRAGTPVSRDEILSQVWKLDPRRTTTRTIDMHISLLRRKLDDDADRPRVLITIHGVGYMLPRGAISPGGVPPSADEARRGPWEATRSIEALV